MTTETFKEKKGKEKKGLNLRSRISLANYITWFIFLAISLVSITLSFHVFNLLRETKYKDVTAIMYMELEKYTQNIKDRIDFYMSNMETNTHDYENLESAEISFNISNDRTMHLIKGGIRSKVTFEDVGLNNIESIKDFFVMQISGFNYFAKKVVYDNGATSLYLWPLAMNKILGILQARTNDNTVYVLSKELKILYSTVDTITEDNIIGRELVQNFIKSPIKRGQIKFKTAAGNFFGFYAEVPNSNLILFSEVTEDVVTYMILDILRSFALGVAIIIGLALLSIQFVIPSITGPVRELVDLTRKISQGDFQFNITSKGFGELYILLNLFSQMGKRLQSRDSQIMDLMEDKRQRDRLDREILIAKKIQENFLPGPTEPVKHGVSIQSYYHPAEEVAGDWYHQFYDTVTDEFIVIVVDVSGHGAGSSMFTAVIASHFEEFKIRRGPTYTIYDFIKDLNIILIKLGKKEWHATLVLSILSADRKKITIINCGHPFPLYMMMKDGKVVTKGINLPSSPVGLVEDLQIAEKTMDIKQGTTILFFTDGVTEAQSESKKQFGRKSLIKHCDDTDSLNPSIILEEVMSAVRKHCGKEKAIDDMCLYAMEIE